MKLRYLAMLAAVALAVAALAAVGRPEAATGEVDETDRTLTVSGTGFVSSVPDRVAFSFGVGTQAKTAVQALGANSAVMRKVIAALKAAGIAAEDIQTEQVSISPRYDKDGNEIVGYQASNSVGVMLRRLARAGAVIDAAAGAGATQVYGPSLSASNQGVLARQALRDAIADARANADAIAGAAGATLGRVLTVNVDDSTPPVPQRAKASADSSEEPPVEGGTQVVEATVTVTYELR
ncbi:MAG: SIMPL domain-containing protein [Actinobacteria bacterium]|nr:SIMPL domain-containing protein [Actinomycetota bacterium]